jgi:hypothetical protein
MISDEKWKWLSDLEADATRISDPVIREVFIKVSNELISAWKKLDAISSIVEK